MHDIDRRAFLATSSLAPLLAAPGAVALHDTLRQGIARRRIPAVVAIVATQNKALYAGAFGQRDSAGPPVSTASIFQIMSMTKAVTTVAALQLVEQGKVSLDEPVSRHLRQFEKSRSWIHSTPTATLPSASPAHRPPCAN